MVIRRGFLYPLWGMKTGHTQGIKRKDFGEKRGCLGSVGQRASTGQSWRYSTAANGGWMVAKRGPKSGQKQLLAARK